MAGRVGHDARVRLRPISSTKQLRQVDVAIFSLRYFGHCMACTSCHDWCCQFGCDVDLQERDRLLAAARGLEPFVRAPREAWFDGEAEVDADFPSGASVRAREVDGACVFRARDGRGCGIHRYALAKGLDYHALKPRVCWLYPVTWAEGVLMPSDEARSELVCAGTGPTLYEAVRDELGVAFGEALVRELDGLAAESRRPDAAEKGRALLGRLGAPVEP